MSVNLSAPGQTVVTSANAARAARELRAMKRSLAGWLRYRQINDALAAGQVPAKAALGKPGARPLPPRLMRRVLAAQRGPGESALAADLHALLSEMFDAADLPSPDLRRDPDAAVKLAMIALSGRVPGEAAAPAEQGIIWLWPLVIVVGAITWVVTSSIRNRAEVEKEREKYECIKAGACTDTGFWLKAGVIGIIAWLAWSKLKVGERIGLTKKKGAAA